MFDTGKSIFVVHLVVKSAVIDMKRFLLLLLLINIYTDSKAQVNKPWAGFGIEANYIRGGVIKHTSKFKADVPKNSSNIEVNLIKETYGKKDWEQRRRYPVFGFGISYTNYGMDSIYGKCISIYPNLQLTLVKYKNFEWTFKAGFGLGYATRKYERSPIWDTLNTAIGSHFNNYTLFATDLRYRINPHLDIQVGGSFSHMSNAAFRQPNLGLNMYGAHIGLRYFPVSSRPTRIERDLQPLKNRWLLQARFGMSGTELGLADGPMFPVYLGSLFVSKRYASRNKVFAGVDYSYHQHVYAFLRNNEILVGQERANSWKSAVFLGNEFLFGRVGILFQVGWYIKQAYLKQDKYYEKLGGNLYLVQREKGFLKELSASVLLKTHKTQAELVEVGLGVGF
jgi:hypothetical protein